MDMVFNEIRDHFGRLDKEKGYFSLFAEKNTRLEGWFKGELLYLFSRLGLEYECEKNFSHPSWDRSRRVDFSIAPGGEENLVELKALMISDRPDDPRKKLSFYFRTDQLLKDVEKFKDLAELGGVSGGAKKWLLVFMYPKPDKGEWEALLKKHGLESPDNRIYPGENYSVSLVRIG